MNSSLADGQIVVMRVEDGWIAASRLGALEVAEGHAEYLTSHELDFFGMTITGEGDIYVMPVYARPLLIIDEPILPLDPNGSNLDVTTDGVYQGITKGSPVAVEYANGLALAFATDVVVTPTAVNGISIPTTIVTLSGAPPGLANYKQSLKIWFNPVPAAKLVRLPATEVTYAQILATANIQNPAEVVILDSTDAVITESNPLAIPPIRVLRDLAKATRGKTVKDELLGSGDASTPFQTFRLAKSPLTYLADPSAPNGRRSTLEVYANGQKWRQAQSFYGARPNDTIYVVRHDEDHQTFVVFGDGELGQRLPTGVNNVVATYRYGVGGNVPANSITALEKPIKGVRKVFNPLPATGGKEPPTPEQQRREAPLSTLVLGRLVSLPDFEAETRRYGNVVSAKARWGWDDSGEDAVVQVWFATRDAGDPSAELRSYLQGMAEPNARIHVIKAKPSSKALRVELEIDPRFRAQDVELEVAERLFDDWDGVLSIRNMPIGASLARSRLYATIHAVPGVLGITGIALDGVEMPALLTMPEDTYLDLENTDLTIGSTPAGLQLFGAN